MNNLSETSVPALKSKSYARYIGVVVALILHAAVLKLMMLSSSSSLDVSGMNGRAQDVATGSVPIFDVAINPSSSPNARQVASKPPSPFERFTKFNNADAEEIKISKLETAEPKQSLTTALGEDVFKPASKAAGAKTDNKDAHINVNGQNTQSLNDLWKAIEPCWRRNATKDTQSVTLVVSFSPLGNLSRPPVIDRPRGASLDIQRLRSEAQAISSLSECGPYLMVLGKQNVVLHFP